MHEPPAYLANNTNISHFSSIKHDSLNHAWHMRMNIYIYLRNTKIADFNTPIKVKYYVSSIYKHIFVK